MRRGKSLFFLPLLLLLTFCLAHCVFGHLCRSRGLRPLSVFLFRISLLKPFLSLMLHVNLGPASSLVRGGPPKTTKKRKRNGSREGGRAKGGGHILSMSNRLVNNHCQQERTKDQKSAIVIFGQWRGALIRLG